MLKTKFYVCLFAVILKMLFVLPAMAESLEVFECITATGKKEFQQTPCATEKSTKQRVIEVEEMTPEEREAAKIKLRMWQDQEVAEEAAKAKEDKQQQEELQKQQAQELEQRRLNQQLQGAQQPPSYFRRYYPYPVPARP